MFYLYFKRLCLCATVLCDLFFFFLFFCLLVWWYFCCCSVGFVSFWFCFVFTKPLILLCGLTLNKLFPSDSAQVFEPKPHGFTSHKRELHGHCSIRSGSTETGFATSCRPAEVCAGLSVCSLAPSSQDSQSQIIDMCLPP